MRHHRIAMFATLVLAGSATQALAGHKRKHEHKKHPVDEVAFAPPEAPDTIAPSELVDTDIKARGVVAPAHDAWHVSFGPYLWVSSVDANVSVGDTTVGSGVDFSQLEQHAKYGIELLGEVRYRDLSLASDLLYGVVGLTGTTDIGPLMVSLDGTASSVLVDALGGYRFYGDDRSAFAVEARGGLRYQRTSIAASVGVAGANVASPAKSFGGGDALAGARVVIRPLAKLFFTGSADVGVFGSSASTWSVEADAAVAITPHVQLSAGYRTLTLDGAFDVVMHGPRAALQLTF